MEISELLLGKGAGPEQMLNGLLNYGESVFGPYIVKALIIKALLF